MQDGILMTGLILKAAPVGEYDRRVVMLTTERGKVTAFARGARRQNSRLMAATNPFAFGTFRLYEGKSAYTMMEADISNYFESLRGDLEGACYGMYFLEIMDFITRENNDEKALLKLLYQSLRALTARSLSRELVRYIFELKTIVLQGEFPGMPAGRWNPSTEYAVAYIGATAVEKLYTFTVTEEVLKELGKIAGEYRRLYLNGQFQSLEILSRL